MSVTILAVLFLFLIVLCALLGYRIIGKSGTSPAEAHVEKCSLCLQKFDRNQLILRQVGDYKLFFFCRECVMRLYADMGSKLPDVRQTNTGPTNPPFQI